jgi:hypothetical protein
MSHLQVLVDGEEKFSGEVPTRYLPQRPEAFPRALGVDGQATASPHQLLPLQRLMLLTGMISGFVKALESPMMQPLDVQVEPRGVGSFTITVDGPEANMDDLRP